MPYTHSWSVDDDEIELFPILTYTPHDNIWGFRWIEPLTLSIDLPCSHSWKKLFNPTPIPSNWRVMAGTKFSIHSYIYNIQNTKTWASEMFVLTPPPPQGTQHRTIIKNTVGYDDWLSVGLFKVELMLIILCWFTNYGNCDKYIPGNHRINHYNTQCSTCPIHYIYPKTCGDSLSFGIPQLKISCLPGFWNNHGIH